MNKKYQENFLRAGALAREVRAFGKALIQKGASYNAILAQVNQKIIDLGARAAFPPQIALNDVAAHFLPMPNEDITLLDQVVKLDVGVCYQGAIGDCAVTVDLSGKFQPLIDAVEAALKAAEQSIKVGLPIRNIGKVIDETIEARGFHAIKNLAGHGLGVYKVHTPPSIPNYDDHSIGVIKPGMTFAIEPFATNGIGLIDEKGLPTIFSFIMRRPNLSPGARALMPIIDSFQGLPFSIHDMMKSNIGFDAVQEAIMELLRIGSIEGYPPLLEEAHGFVAQAENSVLVDDEGCVTITTR